MENSLSKPFSPKDIESHWYDFWESKGFYQAGLDTKQKNSFCILAAITGNTMIAMIN